MYAIKALSVLALAGAAFAAPHGYGQKKVVVNEVEVVYETAVVTVVVGDAPAPTPAPQVIEHKPEPKIVYTTVTEGYVAPPAPAPTTEAPAPPAPEPTKEAPAPAPEPVKSDGYMGVVQEWRAKLGLAELAHDATLEANALKTAADGNGEMKHQLLPGSFGQVLAPGKPDEFTRCFVGGWLCEIPSLPGLNGICQTMSKGWTYNGQTGHAELLTSTSYTKIGCGNAGGIWACDLGN